MRLVNTPIFYIPYIVTPSPLRKDRKSGFLIPTLSFNFINTKVEQSVSLPYYFNIDIDKELTFTPIFNYGGGVDSSQHVTYAYKQKNSGGNLAINASSLTNLEYTNSQDWFNDAHINILLDNNFNETWTGSVDTTIQTSQTYLR